MMIKSKKEMYDYVMHEYLEEATELNADYFDFDVEMPLGDILETYARLQRDINDDTVYFYRPEGTFTGNCAKFLLSCNYKPGYSRFDGDKQVAFIL